MTRTAPPRCTPHQEPLRLTELMRCGPRQAPVTSALLLVNGLVFALMLLAGAGLWHTPNGVQLAWGANFGPATQDGQWWRLFTALFIHFGVLHLLLNMGALWDVGRLVERVYGRLRFALLYLGSGLWGNLVSLVLHGNQAVSGGASGAIFSLYGALLVFLWRERQQLDPGEFRWLFGGALVFSLLMLGMGWVVPGIDNAAHGGGLVAGALWGSLLARPWTAHSAQPRRGPWAAALALALGSTALLVCLPEPSYRFGEELKARAAIQQFLQEDRRISQHWGSLLDKGRREGLSFDQLAGQIDTDVTAVYEKSFAQLMAANPGSAAPSAPTLGALQSYATQRAEVSRDLAQGLRAHDPAKIQGALERARKPPASQAAQP